MEKEHQLSNEAKQLVLGVDGGGTKTEWALYECQAHHSNFLREGRLPASNVKLISEPALIRLLRTLPAEASHVGVFLAGCGTDKERKRLDQIARDIWPSARIIVGSDRDSAFATAFENGDGIAVIAGTGSAVQGRHRGQRLKVGGWGQLLGDRGSGYDLGMRGLRSCLRIYDLENRTTDLARAILTELKLNSLDELVNWAKDADKLSVAKLTPVIFHAAQQGDRAVTELLKQGAGRLAEYVRVASHRLKLPRPKVKLLGGLFVHYPDYVEMLREQLEPMVPGARLEVCDRSASYGAAWLACEECAESPAPPTPPSLINEAASLSLATTEQVNPRSSNLDRLPIQELVDLFIAEEDFVNQAMAKSRKQLADAVSLVTGALKKGGRLFYVGAGTSGRLGVLDASEIPPTFSARPEQVQGIIAGGLDALHSAVEGAEDRSDEGMLSIVSRGVGPGDAVCGITASGRTPFVLGALEEARTIGAATLLLTCNPARPRVQPAWDVEIDLPTGPELVAGSTRLKAGTATKLALNILTTCTMVRLGKVRGNLMIDVHASNDKLRDRATRLVSGVLDLPYEGAWAALERHDWQVRACIEEAERSHTAP